ncbi:hypothetical protein BV25DRAFT_1919198 [Artomyces pyxidatus]|uniref:Uncharacterized protein n=1 Tax=Artomyces pyxidatus TaxID=48021 RepID=A0ACB8SPY5_9AGAM|nr:hypothetical protein BV25DRAFT_1919198 [Artomyces pyxidatus]
MATDVASIQQTSALCLGPRRKASATDPLVFHGRHFGRTIHAMANVKALFQEALSLMAEEGEVPDEERTIEQRKVLKAFQSLLYIVPNFTERIMSSEPEEVMGFAALVQKGASAARADDTKGLKGAVLEWLTPPGVPLNPSISPRDKVGRGFRHPITGRLLCPAGLDWDNEEISTKLASGEIIIQGDQWPLFVYAHCEYDPEDPWTGLFRGELLVKAAKYIFTTPTSVDNESKATRSGNARLHGMTQMNTAAIAYVATQVRFALSSAAVFTRTDITTASEYFYRTLLDFLDDLDEKDEVDELLDWWNCRIFPHHIFREHAVSKQSALAQLKQKRAAKRAAKTGGSAGNGGDAQ